jgi:RimJ/RimL family protein N-acetyltransferase
MLDQDFDTHAEHAPITSVIETKRLVLTPLMVEDADWVSRESGRPEVARNLAVVPEPNPVLAAELFILAGRARERSVGDIVRAVRLKGDNTPVGVIGAHARGDGGFSFGYWYAPFAWGHGYATEAGKAMIEVLRERGATRLIAGFFSHNAASARVLSKLGFERNGKDDPEYCAALLSRQPHVGMTAEL